MLRAYPDFNIVHFSDSQGNFTGAHRYPNGRFMVDHRWLTGGKTQRVSFQVNAAAIWQREKEAPTRFFDPRQRPWYRKVTQQRRFVWTTPYRFYAGYPGITAAQPLTRRGQIVGVIGIDFRLSQLQSVVEQVSQWQPDGQAPQAPRPSSLREPPVTQQNHVFILTADGHRLAGTDEPKGGQDIQAVSQLFGLPWVLKDQPFSELHTQYLQRRKSGLNACRISN
jgi:hypothetical protein